jgi:hypothetical protein
MKEEKAKEKSKEYLDNKIIIIIIIITISQKERHH